MEDLIPQMKSMAHLLAVAVLASVLGIDALPCPPTLPAGGLHLRHHPRPQLLDPHLPGHGTS